MNKLIHILIVPIMISMLFFVEPLYAQYQKSGTIAKDASIFEGSSSTNIGTSTFLPIQKYNIEGLAYALMYFNLPTLPQNAIITDAELSLYCHSKTTSTVNFEIGYLGIPSWSETGINWNNCPTRNVLTGSNFNVGAINQYTNYNVTDILKLWYSSTVNNGFLLIPTSSETAATFYSKEQGNNYAPSLKISYNAPPPPPKDPIPSDGALNQPITTNISWTGGGSEVSYYKVFFGTDPTLRNSSDNKGNITNTNFNPGILEINTTYYWGIGAVNSADWLTWNNDGTPWRFTTTSTTSVDETNNITPQTYILSQNFPNPFNPTTTIKYAIPQQSFVNISIYNLLGEKLVTLVNEEKNPGNYEVLFDGSSLASGVYFYKIVSSNFIETKKLILMK